MRLSDEELREVLTRAEEIERTSRQGSEWNAELSVVVSAAEAVGISRQAVERALSERFDLAVNPPAVGELAWARSADGRFYVAEVLAVGEHDARVRFLRGSEYVVAPGQLRRCTFVPGQRVVVNWPWWGPWTCKVVTYDRVRQRLKLDDGWGSTRSFPVSEVWLAHPRSETPAGRARLYAGILAAGAGAGALIGSILTAILLR